MINCLILLMAFWGNTFLKGLSVNKDVLFQHTSEIFNQDKRSYLIYDQTKKVLNPERFTFLGDSIVFLGYKEDLSNTSSSILLYVKSTELFPDKAIDSFGQPNSVMTVGADINGMNSIYKSIGWKHGNYTLLISVAQVDSLNTKNKYLYRVWTRQISPSLDK